MCGIFAIVGDVSYFNQASFDKGAYRGPEHSVVQSIQPDVLFGFHRLAINGLNSKSNQPITHNHITVICNGEIYNYKHLYDILNILPETDSDCEVIIYMYMRYGIEETLQLLDGVFAFVLYDHEKKVTYVARDPYGVRPLYMSMIAPVDYNMFNYTYQFSSEMKMISEGSVRVVKPGTCITLRRTVNWDVLSTTPYIKYPSIQYFMNNESQVSILLREALENAVQKRVQVTDRPIACLLSGGLDSSLITALVCKYTDPTKLKTFSIGLPGSEDVLYANKVATYLKTDHTSIILSEKEFINAIPEVIHAIESYDTTTVRASVGNYLVAKYIKEHSDCKVIFCGDGADELMGGYLYFHACPDAIEFDKECKRLLENISTFDVLRSDKSISSNGLEPRVPFLDRGFVQLYLSIPPRHRYHVENKTIEKFLIRNAYKNTGILPDEILWRRKEDFSDGVSKQSRSWYQIIEENIPLPIKEAFKQINVNDYSTINTPTTAEQYYYRTLFNASYGDLQKSTETIPYFWMPNYVEAKDASARTLALY